MHSGKRLGLLLPASNSTMEKELAQYLPRGISLHTSRMHVGKVTAQELVAMSKEAPEAAKKLSECEPDLFLYGCTSGSSVLGKGFDMAIEQEVEKATGIPCITTSHAVLNLLQSYGITKIAVGTPYIDDVNARMKLFFGDNGVDVVNMKGLGYEDNLDIGRLSPWQAIDFAKEVDCEEAQCVFLFCTNMQTLETLSAISSLLGKPAFSSNYASLAEAVKLLGYPMQSWLGVDMREDLLRRYL